jgi:UDP-N-acetylglucosamine 1-carboxyvinyltransferase
MAAAAITGGDVLLEGCPVESLATVISKMQEMGVQCTAEKSGLRVTTEDALMGVDISTSPYPGFPTDMQAQMMALMSVARGSGTVQENIFENRFMHVPELKRMGADIRLAGATAVVRGVAKLKGAPVMASDLRASASLVLAGLAAEGETQVQRIYHLDRGYEKIERKLGAAGADIVRVRDNS